MTPNPRFAVVYRWKIRPGHEAEFQQGWATITRRLREERGALGSRLHRSEDGTWVAYAQWPDKATWEASQQQGWADEEAGRLMTRAIAEGDPPILLTPVADYLI